MELSSPPAFEDIWRLIADRTGLAVGGARRLQMSTGLRRAMERAGFADAAAYEARLRADADSLEQLVEELLVGESYFFREPQQCRRLREEILPELRRMADGEAREGAMARRALRIWSAGCAGGEEPYTLAILLDEAGERDALLLGSDLSRPAIAQARSARYRAWSLRSLEPAVVERWFLPAAGGYQLRDPLPARVTFDRINLVTDSYPGLSTGVWGMDLIVCRNVLIYFDRQTITQVAEKLFASLAPGGWLLTGSSDPPLQDLAPFEIVERVEGVFYRRPGAEPSAPRERPRLVTPPPLPAFSAEPAAALPPAPPTVPPPAPAPTLADVDARLRAGDYAQAAALAAGLERQPDAWALRVRAVANLRGPADAVLECEQGLRLHGLSVELHYLMAALLLAQGRDRPALDAARRLLYLDRSLAVGHLMMATILRRLGDAGAAARACQRAAELARDRRDGDAVPLGEGLTWGALRATTARQLSDQHLAEAAAGRGP